MKNLFLLVASAASLAAQITPIPEPQNLSTLFPSAAIVPPGSVQSDDVVFPHFAFGGGWNTTLVIANMSLQTVTFDQYFVDQLGNPLPVTFQTIPGGQIITTTSAHGVLQPNSSFNIVLFDPGPGSVLQIGWSFLVYDSTHSRLGGFSIFQNALSFGTFEALVPLSGNDDYKFYMPFDNRAPFATSIAIANPGTTPTTVTFTFRDTKGNLLANVIENVAAGNQQAFALSSIAPEIDGFAGTVYVAGSTRTLSALGFRFNLLSYAFATVPIMNWAGMFP